MLRFFKKIWVTLLVHIAWGYAPEQLTLRILLETLTAGQTEEELLGLPDTSAVVGKVMSDVAKCATKMGLRGKHRSRLQRFARERFIRALNMTNYMQDRDFNSLLRYVALRLVMAEKAGT